MNNVQHAVKAAFQKLDLDDQAAVNAAIAAISNRSFSIQEKDWTFNNDGGDSCHRLYEKNEGWEFCNFYSMFVNSNSPVTGEFEHRGNTVKDLSGVFTETQYTEHCKRWTPLPIVCDALGVAYEGTTASVVAELIAVVDTLIEGGEYLSLGYELEKALMNW